MNKSFKTILSSLTIICFFTVSCYGQQVNQVEMAEEFWFIEAENHEFTDYKGKKSLYLENGMARIKNSGFFQGIIDFDVAFQPGRKFIGVIFRSQDFDNYEEFYIRAHQTGNPDAMQYTPVINGNAGWQIYHGEGYSNLYNHLFEEWNHIRLIVTEDKVDVFINDMSQPILHVHDLKMEAKSGEIGFRTFLGGAYYANLSYQEVTKPKIVSKTESHPAPEVGTITAWNVSKAFGEDQIKSLHDLNSLDIDNIEWEILPTEYSGIINLSKISAVTENTNTVLAKIYIESDRTQIKKIDFGYSDIARVFVNNQIIYSGQNIFRSRDYRYLGTIGYFDSVYLNLEEGKNEVVFAISEEMGGWGLKARMDNLEGIKIVDL